MKLINNQNWPRESRIRRMLLPRREGEVLLEADLSQAEARVVAWLAQEEDLISLYEKGESVHEFIGSLIMGIKVSKKDAPNEYHVSKILAHGSNYGLGAQKASDEILKETGIVVTKPEAQIRQNRYFQQFPRIKTHFQYYLEQGLGRNFKTIKVPWGWERKFYAPWGSSLLRQVYAFYPQSIIAYITNMGLIKLVDNGLGDMLYLQEHDAIVLSVPFDFLDEGAVVLQEALHTPVEIKGKSLTIPCEVKWGYNWGEMKEYDETHVKK